jgi:Tol biopolymer transport system component
MDEQRLERALRQGPRFAKRYVPSSLALDEEPIVHGPVGVGRLVLILAVTALLLATLLAGLAALGAFRVQDRPISNGWVAFVADGDVYLERAGVAARRIIGSDTNGLDQVCPEFSRDGRRLAYGEADGTAQAGYHDAALVISDLDAAGNASVSLRVDVGETFAPPCATWSADGRRVAFGVPRTSPINPDRSGAGSEIWVVTVADGHVDVLPELLATDLEWSPQGSHLAIASGQADLVHVEVRDGSLRLYDADSGETRTLVGPSGVGSLTWSPDGSRIAYQRGGSDGGGMDQEIWVIRVDGSGKYLLTHRRFGSIYGVGPVWSPTGDRIVYQRMKGGGEAHDVVLVTPDDGSEVVLPDLRLPGTDASVSWRPDSVTWSPDGSELLYTAWVSGRPGTALIVRPLDTRSDPAVLQDGVTGGGENRSWGRVPDE